MEVFPQSVASGDPTPHGAVLWTRVQAEGPTDVRWLVARDEALTDVILIGTTDTGPERAHTVKVRVDDEALAPFSVYHYAFEVNGVRSRTGRLRTLPEADDDIARLRLGYTSCQDWTNGYFTPLGVLADADVDYVVHLGDYIYETTDALWQGAVRPIHLPSGATHARTLEDYRWIYRTYKTDRHLQRCHERHTWFHLWDDHEFANDSFGEHTEHGTESDRRAAATRAWVEFLSTAMHLTTGEPGTDRFYDPSLPPTQQIRLWHDVRFGRLVHAFLTDERLHRDGPPGGGRTLDRYLAPPYDADPNRTMLGAPQREWLIEGMSTSDAAWKAWVNETMLMQLRVFHSPLRRLPEGVLGWLRARVPRLAGGVLASLDQWDGYAGERADIARRLIAGGVRDVVVLTGDLHSSVAGTSRVDYDAAPALDGRGDVLGTCFMAPSVSAANMVELLRRVLADRLGIDAGSVLLRRLPDLTRLFPLANRHLSHVTSDGHGFNVATFTRERLTVEYWAVPDVRDDDAVTARERARFTVARQASASDAPVLRRIPVGSERGRDPAVDR